MEKILSTQGKSLNQKNVGPSKGKMGPNSKSKKGTRIGKEVKVLEGKGKGVNLETFEFGKNTPIVSKEKGNIES